MRLLIIAIACLSTVFSITCDTCKGEKCTDHSLITPEACPQGIHFCYMMSSNGKLFDAGCAVDNYCAINKINGAVCGTCDSDRQELPLLTIACNTYHLPPRFYGGGGDAWNGNGLAPSSLIASLAVIPIAAIVF